MSPAHFEGYGLGGSEHVINTPYTNTCGHVYDNETDICEVTAITGADYKVCNASFMCYM